MNNWINNKTNKCFISAAISDISGSDEEGDNNDGQLENAEADVSVAH